jgi:hypothetical protein
VTAPILDLGVLWGPIRQMVEDAALALLRPLEVRAGGYLETLQPYNGELDSEEGLDNLVKQALGGAPLVLVGAQESKVTGGGTAKRRYREDVLLELAVVSTNLRGLGARTRVGPDAGPQSDANAIPTGDPGVYRILEDIRRTLLGVKLWVDGCDAGELSAEAPVFTLPQMTVWRAHYRFGVAFDIAYERHFQAQTVRARHNLDGGVGVNPLVVTDSTS